MITVSYTGAILILSVIILLATFLFWHFVWPKLCEISENQKELNKNQIVLNNMVSTAVRQADGS